MTKTYSYAAQKPTDKLAPLQIERREPGADDVQIDILFCGVCHSDLHTARNEWNNTLYPSVPGHEIVGKVTAVGANVTHFKIGDLAGVGCMVDSCQHCASCAEGEEQYCENGFTGTYNGPVFGGENTFGGYSEKIVVKEKFVLKISHSDNLAAVAPLLWDHHLLAAAPLESRAGQEGRRCRTGRPGSYGGEDRSRHGRARGAVHHVAEQA
jgi:uncharacterized zinc-type alcohol dehydrogenase-like protein